jgi:hypothetical protein
MTVNDDRYLNVVKYALRAFGNGKAAILSDGKVRLEPKPDPKPVQDSSQQSRQERDRAKGQKLA